MDVRSLVTAAAQRHGIPDDILHNLVQAESGYDQSRVSPKGAMGLGQLMPGTARDLGVDPRDPAQNIDGAARYLKQQHDRFGDWRLAAAAYNAGPGAVHRAGGIPSIRETQAYVGKVAGDAMPSSSELQAYHGGGASAQSQGGPPSAANLKAFYGQGASPAAPQASVTPPQRGGQAPTRRDQVLGFEKGFLKPLDNLAGGLEYAAGKVGLDKPINAINDALGLPSNGQVQTARQAELDAKRAQGVLPGRIGEFGGNALGTALMTKGMSPLAGGAASGALLSDKKTLGGVATDAAIGGITGRLTAAATDAAQLGVRKLLSKVPSIMSLPQLEAAKKAAYAAVDASGFTFPQAQVSGLANDFEKVVGSQALSKSAKEDAQSIVQYTRDLANGDLSLSQLEKLRGDIYAAMVKKGGDTAVVGNAFRGKIDDLMTTASDNGLVREARGLNARWAKADFVNRMSLSADRAAERTYGGDYGRKLKDRLNPLVDEAMPQRNLRGATSDEKTALDRLVRGTKTQNLVSTVGGMLDPRRLGGKILTNLTATGGAAGAPATGGLSLLVPAAQLAAGFGLTGKASSIARGNLDDLLRLIATGGSKQALRSVPTATSAAAERAVAALRPALVATSVPALAAARRGPTTKPKR